MSEVGEEAAEVVTALIHAGFSHRPALDPPATALDETTATVAAALRGAGGLLATRDGEPVGALLLDHDGDWLTLRRVSVAPQAQRLGVASALAAAAEEVAERRRVPRLRLAARVELPATVALWVRLGYREIDRHGPLLTLAKETPVRGVAEDADATRELGRRLAGGLRAGDLLILTGDLGAGKTTLTQGLGAGLGVRGPVTSPTFVLSRVHPSEVGGPPLVHVDAYRLGLGAGAGALELDDLDLDLSLDTAVTVVEWGEGLAERLADDRLHLSIRRATGGATDGAGDEATEQRTVTLTAVGARWVGSDIHRLVT
ncbi:tRNA (adenosine(37)-N6)-threonylcarbamoyltransferase complex ATPase subunit type 1 TsaE [Nocardioides sp. HDW12B]|nr:tRNA (adenosine(37)-N6)-threonylcarbamoyltransferase complex ATPase subunit type 1 TsaE [Nocardioides sp. HDW12B]QIK68344.1 tRNA (adenosine(37)-N6)-threonylcarbamoyltransferase complex ATPase subunit type 1 TsaE [Nocardioides sp. HDW12B]